MLSKPPWQPGDCAALARAIQGAKCTVALGRRTARAAFSVYGFGARRWSEISGRGAICGEVSPLLSGPAHIFSQHLTKFWACNCFVCYSTTISFQKALFCLVHIWAWILRCQGIQECPRWLENSLEDAQFCSEMAHAVGFVPLWEQQAPALCCCVLMWGALSPECVRSCLYIYSNFELSFPADCKPDCFLKYHCGFTAWSR